MPWWGITWLSHPDWPRWIGRVLQNADTFGSLLALALLWWALHRVPPPRHTPSVEPAHAEAAGMRVAVLDDYADAFGSMPCAQRLAGHEVVAFTDSVTGDALVQRLDGFDAVVLLQQRTGLPREVVERLSTVRLVEPDRTQHQPPRPRRARRAGHRRERRRGGWPARDGRADLGAHPRRPATAPAGGRRAARGSVAVDGRRRPACQDPWCLWPRPHRRPRRRGRASLRHAGRGVGAGGLAHPRDRRRVCRGGQSRGLLPRVRRAGRAPAAQR